MLTRDQLDLNIRRLEALEADIGHRTSERPGFHGTFIGLGIAHAGLLSLADATGRLHSMYRHDIASPPPTPGWFLEEGSEAIPIDPTDLRRRDSGQQTFDAATPETDEQQAQ